LQRQANPNIIIALVEEAMHNGLEAGLLFFKTSAKERVGVQDVFVEMVKRCVDEIKQQDAIKQQTAIKQQNAIKQQDVTQTVYSKPQPTVYGIFTKI
ncbi:5838_t:CDS:2, partial [Gigaspora margarita]